jgi:hypothetical protein
MDVDDDKLGINETLTDNKIGLTLTDTIGTIYVPDPDEVYREVCAQNRL